MALPRSQPSCGCARREAFTARPSSSVVAPSYFVWPANRNDWDPTSNAAPQLTSMMKLTPVRGAPPRVTPLLLSMAAPKSVLRKKKPGTSHESRPPGTTLKMSASLPKLNPLTRATSRSGPAPIVRFVTRPRLSVGYHSL